MTTKKKSVLERVKPAPRKAASKKPVTVISDPAQLPQPKLTLVESTSGSFAPPPPAEQVLKQEALTLAERARTLTISDQTTYNIAVEELKSVVALRKKITDHHGPLKAAAYKTHQLLCAAESEVLQPVSEAERILKQAVGVWDTEQTRLYNERVRKTQMEDDRLRNEELRKATADAEEKSALEIERLMLEDNLSYEEAIARVNPQAVVAQAVEEVPQVRTVVPAAYQKASGVPSLPPLYSAEVVDIKELCGAVYRGEYSTECVEGNQTVLNSLARTLKDTFKVPGVKLIKVENRVGVTGK